jgi:hypothetical protein
MILSIVRVIKMIIVIFLYLYFLQFLVSVEALEGSCHNCLWIRYRFPRINQCAYYQKPCIDAIRNCSHYDISFRLIKKGL